MGCLGVFGEGEGRKIKQGGEGVGAVCFYTGRE